MKFVRHLWPLLAAAILIYVFHHAWGILPPLGKLLSPFHGHFQNAGEALSAGDTEIVLPGLRGDVAVRYDDNAVPHIFTVNLVHISFAQCYVMARDRLWKIEFFTLVAAGRLTEVVVDASPEYALINRLLALDGTVTAIADRLEYETVAVRVP